MSGNTIGTMPKRYVDREAIVRAAKKLRQDNEAWVRRHHGSRRQPIRIVQTHRTLQAR